MVPQNLAPIENLLCKSNYVCTAVYLKCFYIYLTWSLQLSFEEHIGVTMPIL